MKSWHPEFIISTQIEQKRTSLAISYHSKVKTWLENNQGIEDRDKYGFFNKMLMALDGNVARLSITLLEGLERQLKKFFDPKPIQSYDLTINDEEDNQELNPRQIPEVIYVPDSPPSSPQQNIVNTFPAQPTTSSFIEPTNQISQEVNKAQRQSNTEPFLFPSIPSPVSAPIQENLVPFPTFPQLQFSPPPSSSGVSNSSSTTSASPPTPQSSSFFSSPSTSSASENVPKTPQRRKSISAFGTVAKEQPSIAEYKMKSNKLLPPSIYAKPKVQEAHNIITVPYKSAPRQTQAVCDPKEEAKKLAGIKEKIYMNCYLQIDPARKEEIHKEHAPPEEPVAEEIVEDAIEPSPVRNVKTQQKSCTENQKQPPRRSRGRSKTSEKSPKRRSRSKSKPRPVLDCESDNDETYIAPDHVYDDIEDQLAKLVGEDDQPATKKSKTNTEKFNEQLNKVGGHPMKRRSSVMVEKIIEVEEIVPVTSNPAKLLSVARSLRSKSVMMEQIRYNELESDEENDKIEVLDKPLKTPPRKRGRPKKTSNDTRTSTETTKLAKKLSPKNSNLPVTVTSIIELPVIDKPQKKSQVQSTENLETDKLKKSESPKSVIKELPVKDRQPRKQTAKKCTANKPKPVKNVARKRGRPPLATRSNIVPQIVPTNTLPYAESSNNLSVPDLPMFNEEDLLVEIPGKTKVPRRRSVMLPKRRNAVDDFVIIQPSEIKKEPE